MKHVVRAHDKNKKNPLTNKKILLKLNPFANKQRELVKKLESERQANRAAVLKEKRSKSGKAKKAARNATYNAL